MQRFDMICRTSDVILCAQQSTSYILPCGGICPTTGPATLTCHEKRGRWSFVFAAFCCNVHTFNTFNTFNTTFTRRTRR